MSLPLPAIDRLFERLTATYGRQFLGMYEGLDANAIKTSWAHELSGYAKRLHDVAWALENLPERPPNAIEFRNLCRKAPQPETPRLPEPPADPARMRAELEKLAPVMQATRELGKPANTEWAVRITDRHAAGDRIAPATLRIARQALARRGASARSE